MAQYVKRTINVGGLLTLTCQACGHTQQVQGSEVGDGSYLFGSRADFCDRCDKPFAYEPCQHCASNGCDQCYGYGVKLPELV